MSVTWKCYLNTRLERRETKAFSNMSQRRARKEVSFIMCFILENDMSDEDLIRTSDDDDSSEPTYDLSSKTQAFPRSKSPDKEPSQEREKEDNGGDGSILNDSASSSQSTDDSANKREKQVPRTKEGEVVKNTSNYPFPYWRFFKGEKLLFMSDEAEF